MIFVGAGLVPAHNRGKHKALPLQNVNYFLIGINSIKIVAYSHQVTSSHLMTKPPNYLHVGRFYIR